jgi:threonine/homoserine/homoserine lactone efflux protein
MAYFEHLWLYFILLVGIVIVPGMDMMFVLANALVGGRRSGLAATAGIMAGGATHTVIGLTAVAILSKLMPAVFSTMLIVGSLYMLWIGWQLSQSAIEVDAVETAARKPTGRVFTQGLVTSLVNPKAWMFVMSVFPQFMKPDYGPLLPQALAMGIMTISVQGAIYGGLALAALKSRNALIASPSTTVLIGRGAGWLLMAVAALTLWEALRRL